MDPILRCRQLMADVLVFLAYNFAEKTKAERLAELESLVFSDDFLLQNPRWFRLDVDITTAHLADFQQLKPNKVLFAVASFVRNGYVREAALDIMAESRYDPQYFPYIFLRVADPFPPIAAKAAAYAGHYLKNNLFTSFIKNHNVLQYVLQSGYSNAAYVAALNDLLLLPKNIAYFWEHIELFNDAQRHFFYDFLLSKNRADKEMVSHIFDKNYDASIYLLIKNIDLFSDKQFIIDTIINKISLFSNAVRFRCYKFFQELQVPTNQIVAALMNDDYTETKLFLLGNINSFTETRIVFLTKYIRDKSKRVQRNALYAIKFGEVEQFKTEIEERLFSSDFYTRDWCRTLLGNSYNFADLYRNKIHEKPDKGCIFGLSECGSRADIPLLLEIANKYNDNLRAYAMVAISRLDADLAKDIAFDNLEHSHWVVRNTAIKTLFQLVNNKDLKRLNKIKNVELRLKLFAKVNVIRTK